ncbi:MAG: LPXTG cell wall anchor domain-containing protein [Rhodobacteraceae bacterium]|nr:LPXTG cell wall anchor domain-containing protein [Paracoccaceae bacterium]
MSLWLIVGVAMIVAGLLLRNRRKRRDENDEGPDGRT